MVICKSFNPIINEYSKVLILGSMPGIKSLEEAEYYAHPQNRFWKIIGKFINYKSFEKAIYSEKTVNLLKNKIALWDVIASCERVGSLDTSIEKEIPNDIVSLLEKYPNINKICLNGNKAYNLFKKSFSIILFSENIQCIKLPSTSPANAKWSFDSLYKEWENALI